MGSEFGRLGARGFDCVEVCVCAHFMMVRGHWAVARYIDGAKCRYILFLFLYCHRRGRALILSSCFDNSLARSFGLEFLSERRRILGSLLYSLLHSTIISLSVPGKTCLVSWFQLFSGLQTHYRDYRKSYLEVSQGSLKF